MTREEKVLNYLTEHNIPFSCYNHPEGKTIEEAKRWWKDDGSVHCKNIFLRNHKGNKHYLVCFHCDHDLDIHDLEARLKASLTAQGLPSCGKLSFASPERMMKLMCIWILTVRTRQRLHSVLENTKNFWPTKKTGFMN